ANTGLALHQLGLPVRLMGKVGADKFGQSILELLAERGQGLADGMLVAEDEDTSYTIVLSPPGVDRMFFHNPGANDTFRTSDVPLDHLAGARYFHFGYPPIMASTFADGGVAFAGLMQSIKQRGLTTSLDMAYPDPDSPAGRVDWGRWLATVLPHIDIFLPSLDEILFMLDRPRLEALDRGKLKLSLTLLRSLSRQLLDLGAAIVVLKLGDNGLYVRATADQARLAAMGAGQPPDPAAWCGFEQVAPCFKADVVGTTGAGDCTIAGFLAGLSQGLSPEQVVTMAVAVGAFNVESADATSGIPTWETVRARVEAGWERLTQTIESA
ncbi:MAG: carbohydrate kinase family protein, partial [Anaerolineae bacterium]|nr:carbohydrate kinase family protein [Anaerolineae bacterium]